MTPRDGTPAASDAEEARTLRDDDPTWYLGLQDTRWDVTPDEL